ncbi:hypothetical protein WBP06_03695 [Novosphingobium sp. BL-8H]|uniref:hypothetical protein n=1 Tax=Novosphingobium sp. BL-8H TaxID=3127640 RepID=UPI0037567D5A
MRFLATKVVAATLLFHASSALACVPPPPPPPDQPVPDLGAEAREAATRRFKNSYNIVYGVIIDAPDHGGKARFRVLHVYAGSLSVGERLDAWSVDYFTLGHPTCPPAVGPLFPKKGEYGVLAFKGNLPVLDFVDRCTLDYWFRNKWIKRAAPPVPLKRLGITCQVYDFKPIAGTE